jgi:hypothetical protein
MNFSESLRENWRCHPLDNGYIMATNEYSLYTVVIQVEFAMDVIELMLKVKPYRIDAGGDSIAIYMYENKRVMGSINDMKRACSRFMECEMERFQKFINNTPYKVLGYSTPEIVHKSATRQCGPL